MVKLIRLRGDQVFVFERIQVSGSVKMKMKQANLIIALFCRSEWFKSEYIEFVRVAWSQKFPETDILFNIVRKVKSTNFVCYIIYVIYNRTIKKCNLRIVKQFLDQNLSTGGGQVKVILLKIHFFWTYFRFHTVIF